MSTIRDLDGSHTMHITRSRHEDDIPLINLGRTELCHRHLAYFQKSIDFKR